MQKMMVKYSHGSLISMDATFSTNKYGYQLYTLMVFDKFQNGVPIAWVVSSRDTTSDIEEWVQAIFDAGVKERQVWKVFAFMTDDVVAEIQALRIIFNCNILLCLWHARRAWLKHVRSKASKEKIHDMFKDLGNIMHECKDDHAVHQAINKFYVDYADQEKFLNYFSITWLSNNRIYKYYIVIKYYMWAKAYRTMRHANQETNSAIEAYHAYIKHTYLCHRKNMSNRRLDWLLWMLLTKIEVHYWYNQKLKEEDFLRNANVERITSTSWTRDLKIPDDDCLLHENIPGAFWVRS
eukprot:Gb_26306 [translate_table: standard]